MNCVFKQIWSSDKVARKNNLVVPILRTLWRNKGITRKELAAKLGISKVAISKNIENLSFAFRF